MLFHLLELKIGLFGTVNHVFDKMKNIIDILEFMKSGKPDFFKIAITQIELGKVFEPAFGVFSEILILQILGGQN